MYRYVRTFKKDVKRKRKKTCDCVGKYKLLNHEQ